MKLTRLLLLLDLLIPCAFSYSEGEKHKYESFLSLSRTLDAAAPEHALPEGVPLPTKKPKKEKVQEEPAEKEFVGRTGRGDEPPWADMWKKNNEHVEEVQEPPWSSESERKGEYDETVKYEKGEDGKLKKVGVKVEAEGLEKAKKQESISLSYFLMGGMGALMLIFHLVNSPFQGVKVATWNVLNMTTSIFVAVLLYGALKGLILFVFQPSFHAQIAITLGLFLVLFIGSHALLFKLKSQDEEQLSAFGTILAHICGFAAMYGFADAREIKLLEELDTTGVVMLIVVMVVAIGALSYVMERLCHKISDSQRFNGEAEERWIDTCQETTDDVFCLGISFLITLLFCHLIRGKIHPYEAGEYGHVTQSDANALLGCAVGFTVLVMIGAFGLHKFMSGLESPHFSHQAARRISSLIQHLNSMIMAWCFLFWAEWQLYTLGWHHTVIGGCIVVANFLTLAAFATVFILNVIVGFHQVDVHQSKMTRKAMKSLELAFGVMVGFSWERAFDVGFEVSEEGFARRHGEVAGEFAVLAMTVILFTIVCPAWRFYILPKALRMKKEAKGAKQFKEAPKMDLGRQQPR